MDAGPHQLNTAGLQEVLGYFDPVALLCNVPGNLSDFESIDRAVADNQELPFEDRLARCTFYHELVHHFQCAGTTYGASLRWTLLCGCQILDEALGPWSARAAAKDTRYVLPLPPVESLPPGDVLRNFWLIQQVMLARHTLSWAGQPLAALGIPALAHSKITCSPHVQLDGRDYALPGAYLLEAQARSLECARIPPKPDQPRVRGNNELLQVLSWDPEYCLALFYFHDQCPGRPMTDLWALFDFALNPRPTVLPGSEAEWRATHPGYRFLAGIEILQSQPDLTLRPDFAPHEFSAFLENLCAATGSPSILAEQELEEADLIERERIHREKKHTLHLKYFGHPPDADHDDLDPMDEHGFLRLAGIQLRREMPWAFAIPYRDDETFARVWNETPPIYFVRDGKLTYSSAALSYFTSFYLDGKASDLAILAYGYQAMGHRTSRCRSASEIECAFSFFDIHRSCPFSHRCSGIIDTSKPWPMPAHEGSPPVIVCHFRVTMESRGLDTSRVLFNFKTQP